MLGGDLKKYLITRFPTQFIVKKIISLLSEYNLCECIDINVILANT